MADIIDVNNLHKAYRKIQALRGVNLVVKQGEIFGFLGPNGAGKTTTIRCMLDLIRPQAGDIRILNMNPQVEPVAVRERIGYLPGELHLESNQKVISALRYFSDLRNNRIDWRYVKRLSTDLELDLDLPIKNLSKGNKQKVGVIQALMHRPELLLMDEPTSGLDPLMQRVVYRLLREAQSSGATIFFSSHIISEVETLADRIAIIRDGVIVEEADPGALRSMAMRRVHMRFQRPVDLDSLARVKGVRLLSRSDGTGATLQVEGDMAGLIRALTDFPVIDIETERPSLEELFLAYYESKSREVA